MKNKYLWLFGENNASTANNNSYYFWKNVVNIDDDIEKYFVLEKNKKNKKIYNTLSPYEKKHIVWRNSVEHYNKYFESDMLFVSLSYLDVVPNKIFNKALKLKIKKPVIYLQHGTLGIKKIGYSGKAYNNNMFRFCIYNRLIKETYMRENDFKEYQLYYSPYLPRYTALVEKDQEENNKNQILWFATWREYFKESKGSDIFVTYMKKIVSSPKLKEYLEEKNLIFKICVHQFFDENILKSVYSSIQTNRIKIVAQTKIDVMDELVKSKVLITDYSSIGFDFTFLNRPVLFFQPDIDQYLKNRELYCKVEELEKYSIKSTKKLIDVITKEKYSINKFYRSRLPEKIDYDYVLKHKQIDKMYNDFAKMQRNKITFIGYNFYGIGGTVNATKSLAEGLLEQGYLVELISLKKTKSKNTNPYGLNINYLYYGATKSSKEKFERKIYSSKRYYSYLNYDSNKNLLHPSCGYKLTKLMKNIKSKTIVSTREPIHLFVNECTSPFVEHKICFYHTANDVLEKNFPGIIEKLKEITLEKAIFVTDKNRVAYKEQNGLVNYKDYIVLGNALEQSRIINLDDIKPVEKKKIYNGIYLLRISKDRKKDVENLIEFGKYLKKNKIKNIKLDVFGTGDYISKFIDMLEDNDLSDYITYRGLTNEVSFELQKHDVLIDLSVNNSFGMTYIEAILNGKKVYCMKNQGSMEVMEGIPNSFIESFENLCKKISALDKITKKELKNNYITISNKYSREVISNKFLDFITKK